MTTHKSQYNWKELKQIQRNLRNEGTVAEATLWTLIKVKQLDGWKFRRQFSIGKYVVDFYCPKAKLIIELDGEDHFTDAGYEHDMRRTEFLERHGMKVIRFENSEIFDNPETVLEKIRNYLKPPLTGRP